MKRRPAWKLLCGIAAALIVVIAAFFSWVQATASRRWTALSEKVPQLILEARGREARRPVLRGEAVPGNAWDDYNQALAAIKGAKSSDLGEFVSRGLKADRAAVEAILKLHEGTLALLASGARKAEGTYRVQFEKGFAADLPGLLAAQNLVNLMACKSRFLVEAGKTREAADLLLDGLRFGADMGKNTLLIAEMISIAMLSTMMDELRDLARDPEMKDVDWPGVARALELLDASWPDHAESMLNEGVSAAAGLVKEEMVGLGFGEGAMGALSSWRYGFSLRLMIADAVDTHLDCMRRHAAACRSWADSERTGKELDEAVEASSNPIVKITIPGLASSHRAGVERRAQLSLLRMAVALRAGQPLPPLLDPFDGAKLRSDGTKVWSIGSDGVDGGGVGTWRPQRTGDIVLQLKKDELELKKK
ncbi:MAG TPA: hypothetical protein VF950_28415 [Planctomycetota bacterium]